MKGGAQGAIYPAGLFRLNKVCIKGNAWAALQMVFQMMVLVVKINGLFCY